MTQRKVGRVPTEAAATLPTRGLGVWPDHRDGTRAPQNRPSARTDTGQLGRQIPESRALLGCPHLSPLHRAMLGMQQAQSDVWEPRGLSAPAAKGWPWHSVPLLTLGSEGVRSPRHAGLASALWVDVTSPPFRQELLEQVCDSLFLFPLMEHSRERGCAFQHS